MTTLPSKYQQSFFSFADTAKAVREELNERLGEGQSDVREFRLQFVARGRLLDGDLRIECFVNDTSYNEGDLKGSNIQRLIDEFVHRHRFNKEEAPLMITQSGSLRDTDDDDSDE